MLLILSAVIVAAAVLAAAHRVTAALARFERHRADDDAIGLLKVFASGRSAVHEDPRALLTWQPLATLARQLKPGAFAALDRAAGGRFPFTTAELEAAHSRWTADWLAWERAHDTKYKLKAAELEQELAAGGAALTRRRLEAVEQEKLETYQRRYQEYVRVAKALQELARQ